jgi:hypothetical protein
LYYQEYGKAASWTGRMHTQVFKVMRCEFDAETKKEKELINCVSYSFVVIEM